MSSAFIFLSSPLSKTINWSAATNVVVCVNSDKSKLREVVPASKPAPKVISDKSNEILMVPLDVIGEPLTSKPVPTLTPTLVTVPEPVPAPISLLTSAPVLKSTLPDESLTKNWSVSVPAFTMDGILYAPADEIN